MSDRRAEALAVLDEWERSDLRGPDGDFVLRSIGVLRSMLERHNDDGRCSWCVPLPCPDETFVIDALLGEDR
jgi:hypothetical protein